jgi:hypothetical protein
VMRFAEKRLNAEAHEDCTHRFSLFECAKCGGISLVVAIERHERDVPGDFRGILRTTCTGCGHAEEKAHYRHVAGAEGSGAIRRRRPS